MSKYLDDRVSSPKPPSLFRKFKNAVYQWIVKLTVWGMYCESLKAVRPQKTWFVKLFKNFFSGRRKSLNGQGV